ncbi:MAG TPA: DUF4232 domain-containing protein [Gaiellaceae bacterium]|nr:DUF4232 domain-containing protein [Gaiellaceae bacterium]
MSGHAPALPLGVDPLIAEAKERARRRRLLALAAAGILVVAGVAIALAGFGGSGSPGTVPWLPTRPNIGPANPPLAPACTASQLKASLFMQGASMSLVGGITIANRGAGPCALVGRPRLSFAGATSKWRETTYHAQNVLPLQYDPLAPPAGSLRALAPGEHVQVLVWWSNWCGRGSTKSGDSGRPARAMVLSAPGGGRLLLHNGPRRSFFAPVCNGGPGSASVLEATHFAPYVPQEPPSSHIPLTAAIGPSQAVKIKGTKLTQPSFVARPGFWLSFTVSLTNTSGQPYRFGHTCPAYTEDWGGLARAQAYVLNCHAIGPIAPGQSVSFAMRIHVPKLKLRAPAFGWTLAPHTYNAPNAMAVVDLGR